MILTNLPCCPVIPPHATLSTTLPVTTFDRYLLSRYFHIFAVFCVASIGLYVVADGFTNLDGFQAKAADDGLTALLSLMARHYLYHSVHIFELIGPSLAVMSTMCVLVLALRQGEIYPVLAAGVPLYRLAVPLVIGVLSVNAVLVFNQECIIPRIAADLQGSHGDTSSDARGVDPTYDTQRMILISGAGLRWETRTLSQPEFLLPRDLVTIDTTVRATRAVYFPEQTDHPAGWLLIGTKPEFSELRITDRGRDVILPQRSPDKLFVCSRLSFDRLYNRSGSFKFVSTRDLLRRIRNPSAGERTRRAELTNLHARFTRPLLTLIGLFLVIPLTARREQRSLVTGVAICMGVVGVVYALAEGSMMAGTAGLLQPALAAWLPLITSGTLCAWLAPIART